MKKLYFSFLVGLLFVPSFVFAAVDDTSVIDQLNGQKLQELDSKVNLETFQSCDDLQSVLTQYVKTYWKNAKNTG